ncbi:T-Complex Protein 10A-like 1 [Manis pentadactyla]|nr:T-Complex Protein 10A-like 1 [Manis pentadactyla]
MIQNQNTKRDISSVPVSPYPRVASHHPSQPIAPGAGLGTKLDGCVKEVRSSDSSCRQLCEVPPLQTEVMKDSERLGWILAKELWLHGPE